MNFWNIFRNFNIKSIFTNATPTTSSNLELDKKDDDYQIKRHLAVMKEIRKYRLYDIQNISDSDIRMIAESLYSLIKESEIYFGSDMFYEELREIKKVLLIKDIRIRKVLIDLIWEFEEHFTFRGLNDLYIMVNIADYQESGLKIPYYRLKFGDNFFRD